ncbi:small, acid-soluble spore protein, alpha/beta type [Haloplasma contractile]|nr:small, acid-soluble spore protein, alpha/beta type [Haloplasma contractile]
MDQNKYNEQMKKVKEINERRQKLTREMDQMKHEISEELIIKKNNMYNQNRKAITYAGNVGGTMTKRLVQMGQEIALRNDNSHSR